MSEENIDTLRASYGALNRGDIDGLVQYVHPEVELHPATGGMLDMGTTYRGRDGMRQFAETAWESFEIAVEPEEMTTAARDRILATERWQMRARDGIETGFQLTHIYTFRDGLVIRIDGFRERAEALKAAGLSE
jgi:ketosteroid isomerase-like protein